MVELDLGLGMYNKVFSNVVSVPVSLWLFHGGRARVFCAFELKYVFMTPLYLFYQEIMFPFVFNRVVSERCVEQVLKGVRGEVVDETECFVNAVEGGDCNQAVSEIVVFFLERINPSNFLSCHWEKLKRGGDCCCYQ